MITVPSDPKELVAFTNNLIEECRTSVPMRSSYYRLLSLIAETGRYDNAKSLINLLYKHLDRTAAHLYSSVELKFSMDFDNPYPAEYYERAGRVSKILRRQWAGHNGENGTDICFGRGVFESLKYAATEADVG